MKSVKKSNTAMIFLFFTNVLALYNETWIIMCKAFSNRMFCYTTDVLKRTEQNKTTLKRRSFMFSNDRW
jgi:hypothetical protein